MRKARLSASHVAKQSTLTVPIFAGSVTLLRSCDLKTSRFEGGTIKQAHDGKTIMIDIDSVIRPDGRKVRSIAINDLNLPCRRVEVSCSHSGNWHVIVRLNEKIDDFAILFAQLYLGSDRKREALNFQRFLYRRDPYSNILFDHKVIVC